VVEPEVRPIATPISTPVPEMPAELAHEEPIATPEAVPEVAVRESRPAPTAEPVSTPVPEVAREVQPVPTPQPVPTVVGGMGEIPEKKMLFVHDEPAGGPLEFNQSIHFERQHGEISPDSLPALDQVAAMLRSHPEIEKIRVEGHTDSTGSEEANDWISKSRAVSVKEYLVDRGIDPGRVETMGYGPSRPIAPNTTREGRAMNRRVQFTILKRAGETVTPPY
jgi:outer membrane protein OmpA-like peptidoglycan-associated protein